MNIHRIEAAPFRIPFRRPLRIAGRAVDGRAGVLIEVHGDGGIVGIGEAAPHPTAGGAEIDEVMQAIGGVRAALAAGGPAAVDALEDRLGAVGSAAARAGLETAYLDFVARSAGAPLCEMFGPVAGRTVPLNALVDPQAPRAAAAAARALVAEGFRCLKLKVSRNVTADAARLDAVRAAVGAAVAIRVDANAAWTLAEALECIPRLAAYGLEYVEQPVAEVSALARVRRAVAVPIAADECVTDAAAVRRIAALGAADVVVVKPALLGLRNAAAVIRTAQACGLKAVVTSALDTSVGIAAALHLAATLSHSALPCGLATASLLAGDVVTEPLVPQGGCLEVPCGPGLGVQLDAQRLRQWRRI